MNASLDGIKSAYRKLLLKLHPDRLANAPPAEQAASEDRVKHVIHAYGVLSDPVARAAYDQSRPKHEVKQPAAPRKSTPDHAQSTQPKAEPSSHHSKARESFQRSSIPKPEPQFNPGYLYQAPRRFQREKASGAEMKQFPRPGTFQYARSGTRPQQELEANPQPQQQQRVPEQSRPDPPKAKAGIPKPAAPQTTPETPKKSAPPPAVPPKAPKKRDRGFFVEDDYFPHVVPDPSDFDFMTEDFTREPPWTREAEKRKADRMESEPLEADVDDSGISFNIPAQPKIPKTREVEHPPRGRALPYQFQPDTDSSSPDESRSETSESRASSETRKQEDEDDEMDYDIAIAEQWINDMNYRAPKDSQRADFRERCLAKPPPVAARASSYRFDPEVSSRKPSSPEEDGSGPSLSRLSSGKRKREDEVEETAGVDTRTPHSDPSYEGYLAHLDQTMRPKKRGKLAYHFVGIPDLPPSSKVVPNSEPLYGLDWDNDKSSPLGRFTKWDSKPSFQHIQSPANPSDYARLPRNGQLFHHDDFGWVFDITLAPWYELVGDATNVTAENRKYMEPGSTSISIQFLLEPKDNAYGVPSVETQGHDFAFQMSKVPGGRGLSAINLLLHHPLPLEGAKTPLRFLTVLFSTNGTVPKSFAPATGSMNLETSASTDQVSSKARYCASHILYSRTEPNQHFRKAKCFKTAFPVSRPEKRIFELPELGWRSVSGIEYADLKKTGEDYEEIVMDDGKVWYRSMACWWKKS
jgi:curved DNA-binding protein CbpA